jgi:site-specific DNA-methyltransferase (cytosine-N4-specific)
MIKANAAYMPLKEKSVQSIITSPPYWGLRCYDIPNMVWGGTIDCEHQWEQYEYQQPCQSGYVGKSAKVGATKAGVQNIHGKHNGVCLKCEAWLGSLGLEKTPELYLSHLMQVMAECYRVLKDDGVCWINLGDTYAGSGGAGGDYSPGGLREGQPKYRQSKTRIKPKSLCLIPERFVVACQEAGWIIRNTIIWYKRNHMPSSVKDRFGVAHEKIFMLTKQGKYCFDLDAVREPSIGNFKPFNQRVRDAKRKGREAPQYRASEKEIAQYEQKWNQVPGQSPTTFSRKRHTGYYSEDGDLLVNPLGKNPGDVWDITTQPYPDAHYSTFPEKLVERMMLCSSKPGDRVLDPFAGSGTTGRVAIRLRRRPVMLDLGYHGQQAKRMNGVQIELGTGQELKVAYTPLHAAQWGKLEGISWQRRIFPDRPTIRSRSSPHPPQIYGGHRWWP